MRCIGCGAEMILLNVVPDTSMMVPGYEHHTLQCSGCYEVEQRLVFCQRNGTRPAEAAAGGAVQRNESPPGVAVVVDEATAQLPASSSAWDRVVEKVRAQQADLNERAEIAKAHEGIDLSDRHQENPTAPFSEPVAAKTLRASHSGIQVGPGVIGTDGKPGRTKISAPLPSVHRDQTFTGAENGTVVAKLEAAEDFDRVWENLLPHHNPEFPAGAASNIDGAKGDQSPPACEA